MGIELRADALPDDGQGLFDGEALLVAALGDQGVEHVRHRHDPGGQRDLIPLHAVGIALPVPALVVEFRQPLRFVQVMGFRHRLGGAGDDLLPRQGMVLHLGIFFVRELAGLVQQGVGNLDLAHVMERGGVDHIVHILVGQLFGVDAFVPHLLHNDAGIGCRLLDVMSGVLVPALHHVRQHGDEAVLHAGDGGVFLLHVLDVLRHICRGLGKGPVEGLDLVPGADVQAADGLHVHPLIHVLTEGELFSRQGHGVEGQDQMAVRQPKADGNDEQSEGNKEGQRLCDEAALVVDQVDHGDVHAHIADASPRGIIQGAVDGEEPAIRIVGDDGLDLFPCQQLILHGQEALVEGDHRAGLLAGQIRRIRVEDHVAAVLPDQIGIDIFDVRRAVPDADEALLRLIVVRRGMPAGHKVPHPVGVDGVRRHIGHAHGHIGFVFDGGVVVERKADTHRHRHHDHQGGSEEDDDPCAQRGAPRAQMPCLGLLLPAQGPLPPEDHPHPPSPFFRDEMQDGRRQDHDDRLVQQVHQEIRCELGEEYASQAAVIEHMGQFGADPIPEAHAIEEPGEHAAQAAADEGIDHDGPQTACRLAEPALLGDDDGDYRDHDAQHAVISGGPVADAVDEVDEITYHDAGDIAPQGGHQYGAQPVQIQGQAQPGSQDAAQAVDQYADGAEEQQLQQAHSRARPEFLIMLFHVLTSGQVAPQGAQEAEGTGGILNRSNYTSCS